MANDYFNYSPLTPNTVARAADLNIRFSGVETGFELLPPPVYLFEDRITYSVDTGPAANTYIATPAIPITAYNEGLRVRLKAAHNNTGVSTLNVSGLGVKSILRSDGTALQINDIVAGQILDLTYDGVNFRLGLAFAELSPAGVMAKIAAGGNMVVNGSVTATSFINNGQTLDGLTAFGVSIAEAANAAAAATLLGLGTAAFQNTTAFATSGDIAGKANLAGGNTFTGQQTLNGGDWHIASGHGFVFKTSGGTENSGLFSDGAGGFEFDVTGDFAINNWGGALRLNITSVAATFSVPIVGTTVSVNDDAFAVGWNGSLAVPTKNAVYDKIAAMDATYAPLASPALTGTPTAPTAAPGTNTTQIASTAFVTAAVAAGGGGGGAPLNSPAFTGVPTAPTAAVDTNTTQLATTAFVIGQGYAKLASPTFTGTPAAPTATGGTNTTQIATTAFVQSALSGYALLASPAFTGNPTAPTQTGGNNTTRIATTAFVQGELANYAANFMPVVNFTAARTIANTDHNNYLRFTGSTTRTITFNSAAAAGNMGILANRGSVNLTLSIAAGAYLNGAGATATSITLAPSGKITWFHEGSGVYTIDGNGAT